MDAGEPKKNVELNEISCRYTPFTLEPLCLLIDSAGIYFSWLPRRWSRHLHGPDGVHGEPLRQVTGRDGRRGSA